MEVLLSKYLIFIFPSPFKFLLLTIKSFVFFQGLYYSLILPYSMNYCFYWYVFYTKELLRIKIYTEGSNNIMIFFTTANITNNKEQTSSRNLTKKSQKYNNNPYYTKILQN